MQANKANKICLAQSTKILDKNCFTKKIIVKFSNLIVMGTLKNSFKIFVDHKMLITWQDQA